MAVSSSLSLDVGVFSSLVRSFSKVDLFAKILPTSPFPAPAPAPPAISLKLGSRRTAALRRRLKPVRAQHGRSSESELAFYPHKFAQVLALLQTLPDIRTRCRQIERYGQQLFCVPTPFITASNIVDGLPASSNTYVHALLDPTDRSLVHFYAHSDAAHIRGLAVIVTAGLSGSPVRTIADMSLAPFALLIGQSLLPARWCSQFMLLLEHMQRKARELITGSSYKHTVEDVLSIMGLGSDLHTRLKDEIDKTCVVHESLGLAALGTDDVDCDDVRVDRGGGDDDVHVDVERKKYDEDSFGNEDEDDGLSWRVKKYPPLDTVFCFEDGDDSIGSTTPFRWG
uniref:Fe-S metabolism associated domain-containing protein n=1 Tax=Ananas comosus var. bracteatus TaxID=296719 RepID=A0A6V7PD88_ANACO|nr:unnamed protein product [Ananas comosus var. bracteatus]